MSAGTATSEAAPTHDSRGLLPARMVKFLFFTLQFASVFTVGSALVAGGVQVLAWLTLMTWSAMAVANARRARPSGAHSTAPRPAVAAFMWLVPFAVIAGVVLIIVTLTEEINGATFDRQQRLRDIRTFVVVGGGLAALISLALPYGTLAKATRWVRGDGGRFWRWFWSPFIVGLLAGIVRVGLTVGLSLDIQGGTFSTSGSIALVLIGVTFMLPGLVWTWMAWKAMTELERAAALTWDRAANPIEEIDPGDRFALARQAAEQARPQ